MSHRILGLLAETSIHPGAGRSVGIVDLPVAREAATDYPVLPGSSLKGALKQWAKDIDSLKNHNESLFGKHDEAGALLISDARLLLLPVRCLDSAYKWVTCPHLLERYHRDAKRAGINLNFQILYPHEGVAISDGEGSLFLEERQFSRDVPDEGFHLCVAALKNLFLHEDTGKRIQSRLAILHDDDFVWFARYGLAVSARNVLDESTKTSKNLWYEETLPPDSLFYALISDRNPDRNRDSAADMIADAMQTNPYFQAGGNETIGMGWFAAAIQDTPQK